MTSPTLQSVSVRAISTNGLVWSYRTRAAIGPQNASLNRAVRRASNQSVAITPPGNGNWRSQLVERCTPCVSVPGWLRHLLPISRDSLSGIFKFVASLMPTAGKCISLSRVRLQDPGKSFGVAAVLFSPFYREALSFAVSHAHTRAWRRSHETQRNSAFRTGE